VLIVDLLQPYARKLAAGLQDVAINALRPMSQRCLAGAPVLLAFDRRKRALIPAAAGPIAPAIIRKMQSAPHLSKLLE
jgi:hypothetical protein